MRKSYGTVPVFIFILILMINIQAEIDSTRTVTEEEVKKLRKRYKNKNLTEKVISFPGKVVFEMAEIVLEGTKQTIKFVDETKIIPIVKDKLTSDDGKRGIVPIYESKSGCGLRGYQRSLFNQESKLSLSLAAAYKNRQGYQLEMKRLRLFNSPILSKFYIRYMFLPSGNFFGFGPESEKLDETSYVHELIDAKGAMGFNLSKKTMVNLNLGFEMNSILEGKDDDHPSIYEVYPVAEGGYRLPGLDKKLKFLLTDIELEYDSRNREGQTTRGIDLLLSGGTYNQLDGEEYGFFKYSADIRSYFNLFYDRVLVVRLAASFREPFPDRKIPFYYMSELGSDETLRGIDRGRFRDMDYLLGSLEYRYPVSHSLDALVFMDAGQVAHNIVNDFDTGDIELNFGFGFRFYDNEGRLIGKIILGLSNEEARFILKLN